MEAEERDCITQEKEAERLRVWEEKIKRSLEEKREKIEANTRVVEELKCKEKEHLRKEALRSQLEGTIASLQKNGAVLELARQAANDDIQQVGREILRCKKEMVILTLLRLSQLQLNDIMSPPH